jgi:hypothetical protein
MGNLNISSLLNSEGTAGTIPFWKWIGSGGFDEVTSFFSN